MKCPRLREVVQGEVLLKFYDRLYATGDFSEEVLEEVLRGVFAQNYAETVIDAARACGVSPSAVSLMMGSLTAQNLKAFQARSLAECTPFALFLDTIHRVGEAFFVGLAADVSGEKMALGCWQGSSENHEICGALFRDLERRGLALSRGPLRAGWRERFGKKLVHQRCGFHKSREAAAAPRHTVPQRGPSAAQDRVGAHALGRCPPNAVGGVAGGQERVGGGLVPGGVRGTVDGASTERADVAAQDVDVDQPQREPVLTGPTQRTEDQAFTRGRDVPALAEDGVALLRAAVSARERICRDCASHRDHRGGAATGSNKEGGAEQPWSHSGHCDGLIDNFVRDLMDGFPTQRVRQMFTEDTYFALLRVPGIESNAADKYAAGFYRRKVFLVS